MRRFSVNGRAGVRLWMRICATAGIIAVCVLFLPMAGMTAFAYDNTMDTETYKVNVTVAENNSYDFREEIGMNYITPHHGIYRYIPASGYRITDIRVPGYEYETYSQNGNIVVKIGSGSYSLTGRNAYEIGYRISMYDDENTEKDMLLLNLIPTGWQTDIAKVSGKVTLPKETDLSKAEIFSGSYGADGNEDGIRMTVGDDGRTIVFEGENLPANHGVSLALELPEGYWTGAPVFGDLPSTSVLLFLLGPLGAAVVWYLWGRDEHITRTLEFYPPNGLTPGEIGYLIDKTVDRRDIISTIVYLADRGYITIRQGKRNDFCFTSVREPDPSEPKYVKTIYDGLFANGRSSVDSRKLGASFGRKYEQARSQLNARYNEMTTFSNTASLKGRLICGLSAMLPMFEFCRWAESNGEDSPMLYMIWVLPHLYLTMKLLWSAYDRINSASKVKTILKSLGAIWFFTIGLMPPLICSDVITYMNDTKAMVIIGLVMIGTLISVFFSVFAVSRKKSYADLLGRILGFRDFIRTAELDKLRELVEKDPEYFYHISPYAYVLGLSSRWIDKFEDIPIVQPEWYRGDFDHFDSYMMGRMMHDCNQSVASHIEVPVSAGSSGGWSSGGGSSWSGGGGFSGGGFSGGGSGGGGGGGW